MRPLLKIEDLSIDFVTETHRTAAVKNISLEVNRGEILAIVGESGSGKSVTSLSILQLLPQPPAQYTSGKILFYEEGASPLNILKADRREILSLRGSKISMIFQEPMTSLNPVMSCGKQVMEALRRHKGIAAAEAKKQTIEWFGKVKLPHPGEAFAKYPHELSGGQKQRVMIAMAMCCQPSLLICDEPTTALDVTVQKTILQLIKELQQQEDMGVIFITHDLGVVKEVADRVAIMYKGAIVEQDLASKIFSQPAHPYTRALMACRPSLHPKGNRLPVVSDFLDQEKAPSPIHPVTPAPPAGEAVLVRVKDLVVRFPSKKNFLGKVLREFTAVDGVSFDIYEGETLGLVGESGCGKTTLGRTLLGLAKPSRGQVLYRGEDISCLPRKAVKQLRREIQLVFQDPFSSLNPRLTIGAAIAEPMKVSGLEKDSQQRKKRVSELLDRVNLSPHMMNRYPHEFSGGQRQRIVIARALALEPRFLVCDESVSALDVSVQAQVLNLLNDLKKELGLTLLFISHDLSVVRYMSDRILVMHKGKIVESGEARQVYDHPQNRYTQELIAAIPSL
ncbi:MAG: ABC transporter ATP-binding protein [Flavisolibacter sp.]